MTSIATNVPHPDADAAAPRRPGLLLPTLSLWKREMVRFVRQKNRVVSALVTPILFWLLLGFGLSGNFKAQVAGTAAAPDATGPPITYLEYFFPGTIVFILLSTAIFSTISVIEDRREGFLQAVLVSPAPRLAIVLGKVLGGATLATIQGVLFLAFWPLVGHWPPEGAQALGWVGGLLELAQAIGVMFILATGLTALGLCIAWPMDSTAGFHAVMMIFLMPMWFLSGAIFPVAGAPIWLKTLMLINPLTYGQTAFAWALTHGRLAIGAPLPGLAALGITVAFTVAMVLLAAKLVGTPRKDGLA
ncbi:MAG: ABC transporter permease [Phycisphaeraceae bacterium]